MHRPSLTLSSGLMAFLILLTVSLPAMAQDRYRAEFIIVERLAHPGFHERMATRQPDPSETNIKNLVVTNASGERVSDLSLVPASSLSLNDAAQRLESSGNYRVLMRAGWVQQFPPDFQGENLRVEIGEALPGSGNRAVEGSIRIDRQRFLHVNAQLNHWRPARGNGASGNGAGSDAADNGATGASKELVTWIRETRRMRSEEIHFLDSPTIGVLVFFRRLDS